MLKHDTETFTYGVIIAESFTLQIRNIDYMT